MRYLLTILFLSWASCYATSYYVDNAGSDANSGTSPASAWQTVAKVSSSSFSAGDSILFKTGGTWNERLIITSSGTQLSLIYIGSYGVGIAPLITGFQTLSGFTNVGNIWTAIATNSVANQNMLLINGKPYAFARYPNTGYLTYTSSTTDSLSITGTLSGTPSYAGKTIVVRTIPWVLDVRTVASQVAGKLTFTKKLTYAPTGYGGNGYFFQNDSSFLDTANEWTFNTANKSISIYSLTMPVNVQYSTSDTLVWLKGSWLTFNGINFTGANQKIFQIDTARGISIQNCSLNYSGSFGILALKSNLLNINNDSIQNCYSGGVYGRQLDYYTTPVNQCDSATVTNNYVHNIGIYAGMGESGNARYSAIYIQGLNLGPQIIGNRVDSAGYMGIDFHGKKSLIKNNIVSNCLFVKDDGGGIYTVSNPSYLPVGISDSSLIVSNIVYNMIGASLGTSYGNEAVGIYTDQGTRLMTVDSNTVYNCGLSALHFNQVTYIKFRNNNLFNNNYGLLFSAMSEVSANNLYVTNNSFYSSNTYSSASNFQLIASGQRYIFASTYFGVCDTNYYASPYNEANSFQINSVSQNLNQWQTNTGLDIHSAITPTGVNKFPVVYLVNYLPVSQTFRVLGTYIAVNGVSYTNYITLLPYQSLTLIKATTDTGTAFPIPSSLPVFISKVIQQ